MGKVTIRVKDDKLRAFLRKIDRVPAIRVGVIGDEARAAHQGTEVTNAQVAAWSELGVGQPRRSWLRDWVNGSRPQIGKDMVAAYRKMLPSKGGASLGTVSGLIGAKFVGEIQKRISRGIDPPNAPSTVAKKGSSMPLIDSGQFRTSITWAQEKRGD